MIARGREGMKVGLYIFLMTLWVDGDKEEVTACTLGRASRTSGGGLGMGAMERLLFL